MLGKRYVVEARTAEVDNKTEEAQRAGGGDKGLAAAVDAAVAVSQRDNGDGARHVDHEGRARRWGRLAGTKKGKLEGTRVEKAETRADESDDVMVLLSATMDEAKRKAGAHRNVTMAHMVVARVMAGAENKRRVGLVDG